MTDQLTSARTDDVTGDPLRFGVGARITVAVMADDYADRVVEALAETDASRLNVVTGDVSTHVTGAEADLLRYVTDLSEAIAASGAHASITLHLSRGCPGEVVCDLPGGAGPRAIQAVVGRETGRYAAAEWSLYPLQDAVTPDGEPDHMRDISAAIALARANGTFRDGGHYVTRLEGDLGTILETCFAGWTMVGRTVQHVTSHVVLSVNSPSHAHVAL